jgi:3-deoxy-D-manno-octulosonic-acid transferase
LINEPVYLPAKMSNKTITRYSQIHQFEPLLPRQKLDVLHAQSQATADKSSRLGSQDEFIPTLEAPETPLLLLG